MAQHRYADAARAYRKVIRKNPENALAHEQLGFAYRNLRKFKEAEQMYEQAEFLGGLTDAGYVNYGQILVKNDKPQEARTQFQKYLKIEPESFVVRVMLNSIEEVNEWSTLPYSFEIRTVEGLNSEFGDFAPVLYDGGLAFTTERNQDLVNDNSSGWNNMPYLAVFYSKFEDVHGQRMSRPKQFLSRLYGDYHVGPISIDTLNDLVYFSEVRSSLDENETAHLKTYVAPIIKGKRLGKPELLPINQDTFSVAHPSITPDGNTLFFASDMNGTLGGMDLFYMQKADSGRSWTEPKPLPGAVNTPLNEVFPYAFDNKTIYFSSTGHTGYGGMDIFKSVLEDNTWSKPINLKAPINSTGDDFGIVFQNANRGYFSSERQGGVGRDDIYQFIKIAEPEEQDRVEVAGVFEYAELPPEGVTLRLLDEHDNLLEEVTTDSLGNFVFTELPANKNYRIEVAEATPEMMAESAMYLLNDSGEKVLILDRMGEDEFVFKTLPAEEFEGLALIEEDDRQLGKFTVFGELFGELPKEEYAGITLLAMDDEGKIIQTVTTDSLGMFEFLGLDKGAYYRIVTQDTSIIHQSHVYYEDQDGIRSVANDENSFFALERLVTQKLAETQNQFPTRGYIEYDDQPVSTVRLMLVDSNNGNLRAARTDSSGYFDFGTIAGQQDFNILLPDSLAALPGKVNIWLIDKNGKELVLADPQGAKSFAFTALTREAFDPSLMEVADAEKPEFEIYGQVYRKLPGDYEQGLQITAVDDEGRVIEVVTADSNGRFQFKKLKPDVHYAFRVDEEDVSDLNVSIFNGKGDLIEQLRLEALAEYVYEKLQAEDAKLDALAADDNGSFNAQMVGGQIYKKLPGDYQGGIKVYAFDDAGNIVDSTITDANGNFRFERLSKEENFTLRVMDEDDSEMKVAFYNFEGHFEGSVELNETNEFQYSKIILEAAADLASMNIDDSATSKLYGQVYKKLPGDYEAGMKVFALDAEGNVIDIAVLDEEGKFEFTRLDKEANYLIRLEEHEEDVSFALLDADGNIVDKLDGEDGIFEYDKLAHEDYVISLMEEGDTKLNTDRFNQPPKKMQPLVSSDMTVYYEYNSAALSADDSATLRSIVQALNADKGRYLRISSHADQAEVIGQRSRSAPRSVSIVSYLNEMGISLDRLYVQNWEDDKPVIPCPEGTPCTQEQRAQNQRTELSIVDISGMPTAPDHIITFEFNQWLLPEEGENAVFGLIKHLKANPELHVTLDGYADTWGSYTSNTRISELRSINIRNILVLNGISKDRITLNWHGESVPFGGCLLEYPCPVEERKQNRRVEMRINK